MPNEAVIGDQSGDIALVASDYVDVDIRMTDAAISFDVAGRFGRKAGQGAGSGVLVNIPKQTVAGPGVPGAGVTYYILQAKFDDGTGTVTLKTDPAATPAPDAGNVELMRSSLAAGANTNLLDDNLVTPDEW